MNLRTCLTKFHHFNTFNNKTYRTVGINGGKILSRTCTTNGFQPSNDLRLNNLEKQMDKLIDMQYKVHMDINEINEQLNHISNNRFIEVYKEIHKFRDYFNSKIKIENNKKI